MKNIIYFDGQTIMLKPAVHDFGENAGGENGEKEKDQKADALLERASQTHGAGLPGRQTAPL